jgi:UTP--glucose-1-phosphate uridylyltransferase
MEDCAVSAVQATRESMLPYYGTVGGTRVPKHVDLYTIERVAEKPTPTEAEQSLMVPGLRAGRYLCFFGMHVLTPAVMNLLGAQAKPSGLDQGIQLSDALHVLASKERYLALEVEGHRHNIGVRYGLLFAQLALSLEGQDREEIFAQLVELLATRHGNRA